MTTKAAARAATKQDLRRAGRRRSPPRLPPRRSCRPIPWCSRRPAVAASLGSDPVQLLMAAVVVVVLCYLSAGSVQTHLSIRQIWDWFTCPLAEFYKKSIWMYLSRFIRTHGCCSSSVWSRQLLQRSLSFPEKNWCIDALFSYSSTTTVVASVVINPT